MHDCSTFTHIWFCVQITATEFCWLSNNQFEREKKTLCLAYVKIIIYSHRKNWHLYFFYWWFNHVNERRQQCPKISITKDRAQMNTTTFLALPHTRNKNYDDIFWALEWQKGTTNSKTVKTMKERHEKKKFNVTKRLAYRSRSPSFSRSAPPRDLIYFAKKAIKNETPIFGDVFLWKMFARLRDFFYQTQNTLSRMMKKAQIVCIFHSVWLNRWTFQTYVQQNTLRQETRQLHAIIDCETWFN